MRQPFVSPPMKASGDLLRRRMEHVVQRVLREHFESCSMSAHDRSAIATGNDEALARSRRRGEQVNGLLEALDLMTGRRAL